jgi:hypothetical protein
MASYQNGFCAIRKGDIMRIQVIRSITAMPTIQETDEPEQELNELIKQLREDKVKGKQWVFFEKNATCLYLG